MRFFLQLVPQWRCETSCKYILECNMPPCNLFGLETIAQSTLVLDDAIFLAACLATWEKYIHCKLQKSCHMWQSQAVTYNSFKTIHASLQIVERSSTLWSRCKTEKVARQIAKRTCYRLQITCNLSCNTSLRCVMARAQYWELSKIFKTL